MQDRFTDKINDKLYPNLNNLNNPHKHKPTSDLESKLDECFSINEDIDQHLKIINKPWNIRVDKLIDHLKTVNLEELTDWIDALKITIIDRGIQTRWTLGLASATKSLPLSDSMKRHLDLMIKSMDATKFDSDNK